MKMLLWGSCIFFVFYFGSAVLGKERAIIPEFTSLDAHIPFLPWTIWFYISQYFLIPFSFLFVKDMENYSPMFYSMMISVILSSTIFMIYPTFIIRPGNLDKNFIDLVRWLLYQLDSPTNCFPSLHVSLACLTSIYVMREHKIIGSFSWVLSLLIIISTMTLKQHYMIDVLGGCLMAIFTCYLADRLTLI